MRERLKKRIERGLRKVLSPIFELAEQILFPEEAKAEEAERSLKGGEGDA